MPNHCLTASLAVLVSIPVALVSPLSLLAQVPESSQPTDSSDTAATADSLTVDELAQVQVWIEELGANEFATRERAATNLLEIGDPIIVQLRYVAQNSTDAEVRLRADEIVKQLTRGDMKSRIEDFLAGQDVDFQGWQFIQSFLGDTDAVRELFVELLQTHPTLLASLEGAARDRALAMDAAMTQVQNRMLIERKFPTRANAFALLLPTLDPNVPLNAAFESVLLSVLQKEAASKIRRDAQLSGPFRFLLNRWASRSTLTSREEVLLLGMDWDLEAALPLAVQTLGEANQTETLATALQTIARFGDRSHAEFVRPLLGDARPAAERGFAREETRTQLGDLAMVTIAVLYELPLAELGFGDVTIDARRGFHLNDVGFPVDDDAPRASARAKIDELLKAGPDPKGS